MRTRRLPSVSKDLLYVVMRSQSALVRRRSRTPPRRRRQPAGATHGRSTGSLDRPLLPDAFCRFADTHRLAAVEASCRRRARTETLRCLLRASWDLECLWRRDAWCSGREQFEQRVDRQLAGILTREARAIVTGCGAASDPRARASFCSPPPMPSTESSLVRGWAHPMFSWPTWPASMIPVSPRMMTPRSEA